MTVTITSLNWRERVTPPVDPWPAVPFLICNATWRVEDEETKDLFMGQTESYRKVLTIDDPDKFDKYLEESTGLELFEYGGFDRRHIFNDTKWQYLPKFGVFWWRQYVSDSPVTRAALKELEVYQKTGKLQSVYRGTDEYIVYQLLSTLDSFWD
jgi:hypothetical protein